MKKLNLKVNKYFGVGGLCGTVDCPSEFEINLENDKPLETLVPEIAQSYIAGNNSKEAGWAYFEYNAKIPKQSQAKIINEKKGLAAFLLRSTSPASNGLHVSTGIYGLKKEGKKVTGKLIEADRFVGGSSESRSGWGFGYDLESIEKGILKYKQCKIEVPVDSFYYYHLERINENFLEKQFNLSSIKS